MAQLWGEAGKWNTTWNAILTWLGERGKKNLSFDPT
jgi:prolyl-tRNA synthetase